MALADDIVKAAAKAIDARDGEPWEQLRPLSRSYYHAHARAGLAAALDVLAEHTGRLAQDFEAQGLGYACERNLEPHEMRKIAEDIRAEVGQP